MAHTKQAQSTIDVMEIREARERMNAAAPELLEACKMLLEVLSSGGDINKRSMPIGGPTYVKILKAAIQKAERGEG